MLSLAQEHMAYLLKEFPYFSSIYRENLKKKKAKTKEHVVNEFKSATPGRK